MWGGRGMAGIRPVSEPEFWERMWWEAKERSPVNRRFRFTEDQRIREWDERAESYADHAESDASRAGRERILRRLIQEGAVESGDSVLDIGSGPGHFALDFAERAARVVAVEPSGGMLRLLESRARRTGRGNIECVQSTWQAVEPEDMGWAGGFDLVFASMSPGISSPDELEKMIRASRRHCYLSGWSGRHWGYWGKARDELWPRIFGEEMGEFPSDILYAFGLLYAAGFRPDLWFERTSASVDVPREEAVERLASIIDSYTEVGPQERAAVEAYVDDHLSGGRFVLEGASIRAFMLWRVDLSRASS